MTPTNEAGHGLPELPATEFCADHEGTERLYTAAQVQQYAIDYAVALALSRGVPETALPMDTAPRDGTMVRLLVEFTDHATEDTSGPAWTIGACNDDNVGDDERVGWQFAGWCWSHDHFTEGRGTPVGWLPMIAPAAAGAQGEELFHLRGYGDVTEAELEKYASPQPAAEGSIPPGWHLVPRELDSSLFNALGFDGAFMTHEEADRTWLEVIEAAARILAREQEKRNG